MTAEFDDGKDEGALRTIGEVSQALEIKPHVLRYWEQQFPMLEPLKRSGGRRYYRPEDIRLVETIDRLVNREGYTLKGAQSAIREGKRGIGSTSVTSSSAPADARIASEDRAISDQILPQLKSIRNRLAAALAA